MNLDRNATSYFVETLFDPKTEGYINKGGSNNLFGGPNMFGFTEDGMLNQIGLPRTLTEMAKSGVIQDNKYYG